MTKYKKILCGFVMVFLLAALYSTTAFAAGTGTPQFGGLYSRQVLELLDILFNKLNIIAFDVVEVAPELDPSLTSMFAARRIITESWGHYARKIGKIGE